MHGARSKRLHHTGERANTRYRARVGQVQKDGVRALVHEGKPILHHIAVADRDPLVDPVFFELLRRHLDAVLIKVKCVHVAVRRDRAH